MSYSIEDSATEALQMLGKRAKSLTNKALRAGRDVIISELEPNIPYESTSDRSWKAQREMDKIHHSHTTFKHMRDDVVYSGIDQYGHLKVGFGKDTYWRVHFVELGTIHQPAQPFISNTIHSAQNNYQNTIANEIRKGLGM